jgi:hypothetical protein
MVLECRPEEVALKGPVFICGTGRCGTSWLHSILREHSHIYTTRWEGRFIVTPGGLFDVQRELLSLPGIARFRQSLLGPWFRKTYRAGTPREYEGGLFADFDYEELREFVDKFEQHLQAGIDEAMRSLIRGVFEAGMQKTGKTRWMEKTPRSVIYMKDLHRLFPDAQFLHIIRDGRDVAVSIVENFWPIGENPSENVSFRELTRDVKNAARYWDYFVKVGLTAATELPPGTCLEVIYEELMSRPEQTLRKICEFIGEPFEKRLLAFPPKQDRQGRWREVFTQRDKAAFKQEANELLVRMGYERDANW